MKILKIIFQIVFGLCILVFMGILLCMFLWCTALMVESAWHFFILRDTNAAGTMIFGALGFMLFMMVVAQVCPNLFEEGPNG